MNIATKLLTAAVYAELNTSPISICGSDVCMSLFVLYVLYCVYYSLCVHFCTYMWEFALHWCEVVRTNEFILHMRSNGSIWLIFVFKRNVIKIPLIQKYCELFKFIINQLDLKLNFDFHIRGIYLFNFFFGIEVGVSECLCCQWSHNRWQFSI